MMTMKQGGWHLQWRTTTTPYPHTYPFPFSSLALAHLLLPFASLSSSSDTTLSPRERRKLRNEKRIETTTKNWREEVEERLIEENKKMKKKKMMKKGVNSSKEELNLENLKELGYQWWILRVSRVSSDDTASRLEYSLSIRYPDLNFKVYVPAVQQKNKLKNGSISVKSKPLYPGCVFFRCVLNKELHDFIREYDGVISFVATRVGNTKRQIYRPKPVPEIDIEKIIEQAKEEQEKADQAFEEVLKGQPDPQKSSPETPSSIASTIEAVKEPNQKGRPKKTSTRSANKLKAGTTVTVVSGAFANFSGIIKKLDVANGKVAVGFTLFGKETIADLDIHEVVAETK